MIQRSGVVMRQIGLLFLVTYGALHAKEYIDLEAMAQDFVLETKQIVLEGYAGAFNSSIIRWGNKLLLCFRVRNNKMISTFEIGFVWLDDDFNPISTPRILDIRNNSTPFSQNQDPRLIVVNKKLYIIYNNFIKMGELVTRRMFVAQLICKDDLFFIDKPVCLQPFEGWSDRWEKNWAPFVFDDQLLLAYSLLPHRVFHPSLITGECVTVGSTYSSLVWNWGELRGGTPAVRDGDEYIAFFHSSIKMSTVHSNGKTMPHYVMGAYTFSAKPPFEITRVSPEPIVGKQFYKGHAYNTWKPLRVVFPMGCVMDENYIWVTYGRQDFEIWVAKFDKKRLYQSLIPCTYTEEKKYPDYQTNAMFIKNDSAVTES